MTQATTNGTFTAIMERFRPTGWVRVPDKRQPSGTQIKLILPATQFRATKQCHQKRVHTTLKVTKAIYWIKEPLCETERFQSRLYCYCGLLEWYIGKCRCSGGSDACLHLQSRSNLKKEQGGPTILLVPLYQCTKHCMTENTKHKGLLVLVFISFQGYAITQAVIRSYPTMEQSPYWQIICSLAEQQFPRLFFLEAEGSPTYAKAPTTSSYSWGHAAGSLQLLSTEAWLQFQSSPCEDCDGQSNAREEIFFKDLALLLLVLNSDFLWRRVTVGRTCTFTDGYTLNKYYKV